MKVPILGLPLPAGRRIPPLGLSVMVWIGDVQSVIQSFILVIDEVPGLTCRGLLGSRHSEFTSSV
jgi:hypothetical protein